MTAHIGQTKSTAAEDIARKGGIDCVTSDGLGVGCLLNSKQLPIIGTMMRAIDRSSEQLGSSESIIVI